MRLDLGLLAAAAAWSGALAAAVGPGTVMIVAPDVWSTVLLTVDPLALLPDLDALAAPADAAAGTAFTVDTSGDCC